jgi:YHS domain-containing protein
MKIPIIPTALALVGASFIVAALSGFSQRPIAAKQSQQSLSAPTSPSYPLSTCVVSGEKLGEMGKPAVINYQGTEVRFCCAMCVDQFKKDPAKYLAKLPAGPKP